MDLQELIDRQQIIETINNLANYADLGRWDNLRTDVFASEVTVDYTSLIGGEAHKLAARDLVDSWRSLLPGFEATQHMLSNHQVEVCGDEASASAYVRAYHYLPNKTGGHTWMVAGYYNYELSRQLAGWRVTALKLNLLYTEGNQNLVNLARTNSAVIAAKD